MNATILNARARYFEATSETPWMSVKYMISGSARYQVGRSEYEVGQGRCLILNNGSPYRITINSSDTVESLVVFFPPDHVASMIGSLTHTDEQLLDNPFTASDSSFRFQESIYLVDRSFREALGNIQRENLISENRRGLTHESVEALFRTCLSSQSDITRDLKRLDAIRPATRQELQRRLTIARDYLLSNYSAKLSLNQIAGICGLSPYHLSRQFKTVYGIPPMTFLRDFRLSRAIALLRSTNKTVLDVCLEVGFESPTTLSSRIKALTGSSPRKLRKE